MVEDEVPLLKNKFKRKKQKVDEAQPQLIQVKKRRILNLGDENLRFPNDNRILY